METITDLSFGIAWSFREPAIVLLGSSESLPRLASFLNTLSDGGAYKPDFIAYNNAELEIVVTEGPSSLKVTDHAVTWTLPSRMLTRYAQQIESVASHLLPCHDYLDPEASGAWTLIVSKGEYSDEIFR